MLSIQERILDKSVDSLDQDDETSGGELRDGERAIVREMCNVSFPRTEGRIHGTVTCSHTGLGNYKRNKESRKRKLALVQENTHVPRKRTRSRKHALDQESVQGIDAFLVESMFS